VIAEDDQIELDFRGFSCELRAAHPTLKDGVFVILRAPEVITERQI